jgi:hypothetical protein
VNRRIPLALAATAVAVLTVCPTPADAQVRVAVRRPAVAVRPSATIFIGGYYYPTLYRASLFYGPYYSAAYYRGYYGYPSPFYQPWPYGYGYPYDLSGSMRLQVAPKETEVFVDGYYAGTVDDFDGVFQRLNIEPGDHDIELYLPGHRPFRQRVYLQPGRTFRIRHAMEPLAPGEPDPVRPSGAPLPPPAARDPRQGPGPAPAPPPQGARAQGFGELSLRVQPADAQVLIDGEPWEGSLADERLVVQLGAGVHRLEIRKDGYRSYFTDVTVRDGETRTVNVALTQQ